VPSRKKRLACAGRRQWEASPSRGIFHDRSPNLIHFQRLPKKPSGETTMKAKITEDWWSVIIAFGLIFLALVGIISPTWMKF
jgi:hypothetical protein